MSKLQTPFDKSHNDSPDNAVPSLRYVGDSPDDLHHLPQSASGGGSFNALLNKLGAAEGPDLALGRPITTGTPSGRSKDPDDLKRGGAHRGTKDYPHLQKSDVDIERMERQALVDLNSDSDENHPLSEPSDNEVPPPIDTDPRQSRRSSRRTSSNTGRLTPAELVRAKANANQNSYPPGR